MKQIRAHLIISGRVQGVYFRMETRNAALRQKNVYGWVRNLPDGTVEAVFEGNETDVNAMIIWCSKGPTGALVNDVKLDIQPYSGQYNDFNC